MVNPETYDPGKPIKEYDFDTTIMTGMEKQEILPRNIMQLQLMPNK
jgi:hypothetical protein